MVTARDDQSAAGAATFNVTVSDPAVTASAISFTTPSNTALTNQPVATFTDPAGAEPNASDPGALQNHYSATINWGDGSTSTGTITASGNTFTVTGSHIYTFASTFTTSVTISHENA